LLQAPSGLITSLSDNFSETVALLSFEAGYLFIIVEQMSRRDYLGNLELMVLLALIRLGEDAYGVPISREIEERSGREVALGSVYATLERLEEKGLVSSDLGEPTPERGGRAKKYFRVTPRGLREVRETQRALKRLWHGLRQLEGETA
jgi:PadR family transcriptional regulator, regulatory protein PadR